MGKEKVSVEGEKEDMEEQMMDLLEGKKKDTVGGSQGIGRCRRLGSDNW